MSDQRDGGIAWCDETWNPVRGCSRVSPGCEHCYAERVAARFSGPGQPYEGLAVMREKGPRWTGRVRLIGAHLADPLRWRRPRRVFVNSMSDLFHESLTNEEIAAVFGVMAAAPRHTFQVLTKRARRMREWFTWAESHESGGGYEGPIGALAYAISCSPADLPASVFGGEGDEGEAIGRALGDTWPLANVWLGVSVEDQQRADERIPHLLATPAAVRFISAEPLLGPIDLWTARYPLADNTMGSAFAWGKGLNWVIAGAESGPGARPMQIDWVRTLHAECKAGGAAFFFKQDATPTGRKIHHPLLDGHMYEEWPA